MKNIFLIIIPAIFVAFIQSNLIHDIRVNFIFSIALFIMFFIDFDESILFLFVSSLLMDIFSLYFGAYFFAFFTSFLIMYYISKNLLSSDRSSTYFILTCIGIILFNFIFYFLVSLFASDSSLFYTPKMNFILNDFFREFIMTFIFSGLLYVLANLFSKKTRNRFIIIGN